MTTTHTFQAKMLRYIKTPKNLLCDKDGWILTYNGIKMATKIALKYQGTVLRQGGSMSKFYIEQI